MTMLFEKDQAPGSEIPVPDRVLAYIVCPILFLLTCFFLIRTGAAAQANGSVVLSFWLLGMSGTLLLVCCILSAWRMATLSMERNADVREAGLQRRARYFEEMLHLIADNIPNILFISDKEGRIWFANRETVRPLNKEAEEITGKTLDRIFAARDSEQLIERIRRAQDAGAPVVTMDRRDDVSGPRYLETYHIPLPSTSDLHDTVMVTQKDITGTMIERERQEQFFKQLVDVLIAVIDRRDPYAAGHSLRVGTVATQIARHLKLDDPSIEACRVAGSLMNLGKIMVPRSVLVKTSTLEPEELKLVRKSILASADILSLISFQIPVIPTLRQVLERYDGSGAPEGRKGENILLTARIVALSNAFIALVSPRAHRAGLSVQDALNTLQKDAGTAFDPRVVKALVDHLKQHPEMQERLVKPAPEIKGAIT